MAQMKSGPKWGLIIIAVVIGIFGFRSAVLKGWVPGVKMSKSILLKKADLPDIREAQLKGVEPAEYPTDEVASVPGPQVRALIWAWNAQMGWIYANGGPLTTEKSLMAKHGVNLKLTRQDDTNQMINDLMACAQELEEADDCASGAHFMAIMGDQTAAFFASNNPNFKKICEDCTLEWIGSAGRSDGEDAFMGPAEWKEDPQKAKGGLVSTVIREGDWNIVVKWAADNGIPVNPDERTFDPGAVNFVNAATYTDAAEKYVANYCEDRRVVNDGKPTGEKKNVCVQGVSTWTPADVTAAKGRGGIVRIVSTRQYRSQMPNAIIGIKKWNKAHAKQVAGMLAAIFEAGDQIRAYPEALEKASVTSWKVYNEEQSPEYWLKYYKGTEEEDATGNTVQLGGSKVYGLADNLVLFGMAPGSNNNGEATYRVFGNFVKQLYPKIVPEYPKFQEIFNPTYIQQAKALVGKNVGVADVAKFSDTSRASNVVSRKAVYIQFDTGQASLRPEGLRTLENIKDDLAIAGSLVVKVYGHTDSVGNPEANQRLSEARAAAVKSYLMRTAPSEFPSSRFRIRGVGDQQPIADNGTDSGRAKNRRVEIVLADPSS
jgi:OmpA-OmpF porin, OOP family